MSPIARIALISVPVADQPRAKRFYVETLGFAVQRDEPMGEGRRWVQLGPPGAETSIALVSGFDAMKPGSLQGALLETADIDAAHEALRAKGLALSEIAAEPWGRYARFSDPDGNGWILQQSAKPTNPSGAVLDQLFRTIQERRGAETTLSYTSKLLAAGAPLIAKKLGEEAVETIIEAIRGDPARLAAESADLLYHLLVLWASAGVAPTDIWQELERRQGVSGIAEKNARPSS